MSVRVADRFGGTPCVSIFELSDKIFDDKTLSILKFENLVKKVFS
jgi:hypothetical protein